MRRLEGYVSRRYQVERIERRWSAELFEPADGLPFIGQVPSTKHLYIATGFSGTGLTYGTAAGQIVADLILGRPSIGADLFSHSRFKPLAAAKELLCENLNVLKRFVGAPVKVEKIDSMEAVQRGEGRIVQLHGTACAVYRDDLKRISPTS